VVLKDGAEEETTLVAEVTLGPGAMLEATIIAITTKAAIITAMATHRETVVFLGESFIGIIQSFHGTGRE
jgi:hypothetical protein